MSLPPINTTRTAGSSVVSKTNPLAQDFLKILEELRQENLIQKVLENKKLCLSQLQNHIFLIQREKRWTQIEALIFREETVTVNGKEYNLLAEDEKFILCERHEGENCPYIPSKIVNKKILDSILIQMWGRFYSDRHIHEKIPNIATISFFQIIKKIANIFSPNISFTFNILQFPENSLFPMSVSDMKKMIKDLLENAKGSYPQIVEMDFQKNLLNNCLQRNQWLGEACLSVFLDSDLKNEWVKHILNEDSKKSPSVFLCSIENRSDTIVKILAGAHQQNIPITLDQQKALFIRKPEIIRSLMPFNTKEFIHFLLQKGNHSVVEGTSVYPNSIFQELINYPIVLIGKNFLNWSCVLKAASEHKINVFQEINPLYFDRQDLSVSRKLSFFEKIVDWMFDAESQLMYRHPSKEEREQFIQDLKNVELNETDTLVYRIFNESEFSKEEFQRFPICFKNILIYLARHSYSSKFLEQVLPPTETRRQEEEVVPFVDRINQFNCLNYGPRSKSLEYVNRRMRKAAHFDDAYAITNWIESDTTPEDFNKWLQIKPNYRLDDGAGLNQTALLVAVEKGNKKLVEHLLKLGTKQGTNLTEIATDYGALPLMAAFWQGNFEMIRILIAGGANPNIRSTNPRNTLIKNIANWEDKKKSINALKLLIRHGAHEDICIPLKNEAKTRYEIAKQAIEIENKKAIPSRMQVLDYLFSEKRIGPLHPLLKSNGHVLSLISRCIPLVAQGQNNGNLRE